MANEGQQEDTKQEDAEAEAKLADAITSDGSPEDKGGQFDEQRAREALNKKNAEANNLRKRLKELEPLAAKAKELEDANKTELEKLTEQLQTATADGTTSKQELQRLQVALAKAPDGMAPAKILSLAGRLKGSTQEELEADAEELFAEFAPPGNDAGKSGQRPKENLRTVSLGTDGETDKTDMNSWMRDRASMGRSN